MPAAASCATMFCHSSRHCASNPSGTEPSARLGVWPRLTDAPERALAR